MQKSFENSLSKSRNFTRSMVIFLKAKSISTKLLFSQNRNRTKSEKCSRRFSIQPSDWFLRNKARFNWQPNARRTKRSKTHQATVSLLKIFFPASLMGFTSGWFVEIRWRWKRFITRLEMEIEIKSITTVAPTRILIETEARRATCNDGQVKHVEYFVMIWEKACR